ncbi:MAG: transposase [Actinophytocola sp.]|nr:transposase [Actinophytocola sp.]
MKVTRIAYSADLNTGKYVQLEEQARRLGRVRSKVWRQFGSVNGAGVSDRAIRDEWMADGTAGSFAVLANAWKETVRDAVADITANREAAKAKVRKAINRRTQDPAGRKRLFTALRRDTWTGDPYLRRLMRQHCKRGRNRTHNQIVVRSDQHKTFTLTEGGNVWLAIPGLQRRQLVTIPLNTTIAPVGTLRLILRGNRVEVHHGSGLGELLSSESDHRKVKNARRAKLRSIAEHATERGDHAKARRIRDNNLGGIKRRRRSSAWQRRVRDVTFKAAHAVIDKAAVIVAEDLTKTFTGRTRLGKNTNRRLAAWTKGVTAEALANVSERRGSASLAGGLVRRSSRCSLCGRRRSRRGSASLAGGLVRRSSRCSLCGRRRSRRRSALRLVNAAYTSQVIPGTDSFGKRAGDRLHCTSCGAVWQADHAAAINILERAADPDIGLHTPHIVVKQIIQDRDRQRSRLPDQDSNTKGHRWCGERNIRNRSTLLKE